MQKTKGFFSTVQLFFKENLSHHISLTLRSLLLIIFDSGGWSAMISRPSSSLSVLEDRGRSNLSESMISLLSLKESWYNWSEVELEADELGLKKGLEDGVWLPRIKPFSVRLLLGWFKGLTNWLLVWLVFLAFINSAASALDMFSCFFHLVRRFWNQIFTWKNRKKGWRPHPKFQHWITPRWNH